jgi:hypothetical protein
VPDPLDTQNVAAVTQTQMRCLHLKASDDVKERLVEPSETTTGTSILPIALSRFRSGEPTINDLANTMPRENKA